MSYEETQKLLEEYFNLSPQLMDEDATDGSDLVRFGELSHILFEKDKVLQNVHVFVVTIPKDTYDNRDELQDILNTFNEELGVFEDVDISESTEIVLTPEWEDKLFNEEY